MRVSLINSFAQIRPLKGSVYKQRYSALKQGITLAAAYFMSVAYRFLFIPDKKANPNVENSLLLQKNLLYSMMLSCCVFYKFRGNNYEALITQN